MDRVSQMVVPENIPSTALTMNFNNGLSLPRKGIHF